MAACWSLRWGSGPSLGCVSELHKSLKMYMHFPENITGGCLRKEGSVSGKWILLRKFRLHFIYCVYGCTHVEIRGQLARADSALLSHGSLGLNSGCHTWRLALLPVGHFLGPSFIFPPEDKSFMPPRRASNSLRS